jgi:quercetin dioxygenase-like cupin family protein
MVTESSSTGPRIRLALALAAAGLLVAACGGGSDETPAAEGASPGASAVGGGGREVLLEAQAIDALDQAVAYPKKVPAQVSSEIVTLEPGQETGWHRHRVPQYVYVMQGSMSVEYDAGVIKEYPAGTAYLEAQGVWHNATNKGDEPVRTLLVYLGAEGAKNTVER